MVLASIQAGAVSLMDGTLTALYEVTATTLAVGEQPTRNVAESLGEAQSPRTAVLGL